MGSAKKVVKKITKKVDKVGNSVVKNVKEVVHKPFSIVTKAGTLTVTAATLGQAEEIAKKQEEKILRSIRTANIAKQIGDFQKDPYGKTAKSLTKTTGEVMLGAQVKALKKTGSGRMWLRGEGKQGGVLSLFSRPIGESVDVTNRFVRDPTLNMGKFQNMLSQREEEINPSENIEKFIGRTQGVTQAQLDALKKKGNILGTNPNINIKAPAGEEFRIDQQPLLAELNEIARVEAALSGRADFIKRKRAQKGRSATLLGRKNAII